MTTFAERLSAEHRRTEPVRACLTFTGITGLLSIVGLAAFLAANTQTGADPLSASRSALTHSLAARNGADVASIVLAVSALSYIPLILFFGGLRRLLEQWQPSGLAASIVGIAAPLFLAGAVASDGFGLAVAVAQHSVSSFTADATAARVLAAGWRVSLVEAQVALATLCATAGAVFLRAPASAAMMRMPRWVGIWGLVSAAAVIPLVADPGAMPVFVGSNIVRFGWILVMSVTSLSLARRLSNGAA